MTLVAWCRALCLFSHGFDTVWQFQRGFAIDLSSTSAGISKKLTVNDLHVQDFCRDSTLPVCNVRFPFPNLLYPQLPFSVPVIGCQCSIDTFHVADHVLPIALCLQQPTP